ncbi:MAG TPA: YdeI/OmpD-associated family protein [Anaerolineales bacterium]|jgi:hypothetical protein
MSRKHSFSAKIENAGGGGAFVRVPFDVEAAFGDKRPKVKAMIEGVPYRGILSRMGSDYHMLIVLKGIREKIGKTFGDSIQVTVESDAAPRVVKIPADLARAFKQSSAAKAFFKKLSYTHQKEYVVWITGAKRPETRQARLAKTIELLKKGRKEK